MYAPTTPLESTTCTSCGGDGPVRVVDEAGATQLCVLHAMALLGRAEDGLHVALVIGAEVTR